MDIYVINKGIAENIDIDLLNNFKYKNFKNESKQIEHSLSYLMLDRILREVYKISNRELEFSSKKPYLKNREKYFSLSHSEKYIVLAFSDCECGVDIEAVKQRDYKKIAERMNFSSNSLIGFYEDWTMYEAEYKLNMPTKSNKCFYVENCVITAVSSNINETFEIYIQTSETFPKS